MRFTFLILGLTMMHAMHYAQAQNVPPEYQALYGELQNKLIDVDKYIGQQWDGAKHPTAFCTELLIADGNRGELLLQPQVLTGLALTLDRLQSFGFKTVAVSVGYPLFVPTFPRSAEYIAFYKKVFQEIRKRNMRVHASIGSIFPNPAFSTIPIDYTGLTLETYKQEKRAMIELMINDMHPDYLTVEDEPATMQMNMKLPFTVQNVTDIVKHFLNGLDRKGIPIGAGIGTWESIDYIQSLLANTTIDFVDLHVYPINRDFVVDKVMTIGAMTRVAKRSLVIGECWLYKILTSELGTTPGTEENIFARDAYSFFIPLDEQFFSTMIKLAHFQKIDLLSFFWMKYLYGYLDYTQQTKALTPIQTLRAADSVAAINIYLNKLSKSGETLKNLIAMNTEVASLSRPEGIKLEQNYPNPFVENTTISFQITDFGLQLPNHQGIEGTAVYNLKSVILKFYDLFGREVLDLSEQARTSSEITIHRSQLPRAGVYFYRLSLRSKSFTKMMVMR